MQVYDGSTVYFTHFRRPWLLPGVTYAAKLSVDGGVWQFTRYHQQS